MREIRTSGSEGGAGLKPRSYLYHPIEKDGALERRFLAVRIEEPSAEEAVAILLALRPRLEAHHGVALEEAALQAAVEWSVRYLPDFRLPDKALDLVDQACAAARFDFVS